jgi:hypothetical protein
MINAIPLASDHPGVKVYHDEVKFFVLSVEEFNFSLSTTTPSRTIMQGETTSYRINVNLVSGTPQNVMLSISGQHETMTCKFSISSGLPTFSTSLLVMTKLTTPPGTYDLVITATGGGRVIQLILELKIERFNLIFSPIVDGYNFRNWDLTEETWKDMKAEIEGYLGFRGGIPLPWLTPVLAILYIECQWGGHCYGMASTSILYYTHEIDKPVGYEDMDVYDWPKSVAQPNIERYHAMQIYNILSGIKKGLQKGYNPIEEYEKIKASLQSGRPIMLLLTKPFSGHAVTAIGVRDIDESNKIIYLYDNRVPGELEVATIVNNQFYYSGYNVFFAEAPSVYWYESKVYLSLMWEVYEVLQDYLKDLKRILVTLDCPANLMIVDQFGRRIGYVDGVFVNEIPGAEMEKGIDVQAFYIPSDLTYKAVIIGAGQGTFDFSIMTSDKTITYINIPLTEKTQATLEFSETAREFLMKIDANGDGIIDQTESPSLQLTIDARYVRLVSVDPSISELIVVPVSLSDIDTTKMPSEIRLERAFRIDAIGTGSFTLEFLGIPNPSETFAYKIDSTTKEWVILPSTPNVESVFVNMTAGDPIVVLATRISKAPSIPTYPVGGAFMPVNKLAILSPYLALIGLAAVVAVAIKKRRR